MGGGVGWERVVTQVKCFCQSAEGSQPLERIQIETSLAEFHPVRPVPGWEGTPFRTTQPDRFGSDECASQASQDGLPSPTWANRHVITSSGWNTRFRPARLAS
jgi:hypothetical protein